MQNFAQAVEATKTAINSQGSAVKENEAYMDSLEARVSRLKGLFQELSQSVVGSDLVGGLIDLAEGILTFANTDFGSFVTQAGLLTGAVSGIYGMLSAGILGGVIPSITVALPYITAASAAFLGVYRVVKLVEDKLDEAAEVKIFDNVEGAIEESKKQIAEYDSKIEEAKNALIGLQTIPPAERTPEIEEEIAKLQALITAYQKLKEVEEERIRTKYAQQLRGTEFVDSTGFKWSESSENRGSGFGGMRAAKYSNISAIAEAMSKTYSSDATAIYSLAAAFATVDENMAELIANDAPLDTLLQKLKEYDVELTHDTHTWAEELKTASTDMQHQIDLLETYPQFADDFTDATKEMLKTNKDYYETLKTLEETGASLTPQEQEFIQIYENLKRSLTQATVGTEKFAEAQEKAEEIFGKMGKKGSVAQLEQYVKALKEMGGLDDSGIISVIQDLSNLGIIDVDYLDDELSRILNKLQQIPETTDEINNTGATVKVDADTEGIPEEVQEAMAELKGQGITITSSADASALQESLQAVSQLIDTLNTKTLHVNVDSNVSEVMQSLNNLTSTINSLPSGSFSVYLNDYASSKLNSIYATYSKLKDKTITITTVYKQEGSGSGSAYAEGTDYFKGGQALINDGKPVNGSAAELVVANGKASIYNQGEPAIVNLPVGAKIYTAEETQDILHNIQSLKDSIPAFADGNVREPATINAETIQYDPSEYYSLNLPATITTPAAFEAWLKEKKHLLELDLITQEQYYLDLEYMNENYLKNMYNTQDDYWQYQEEVYKWKKEQVGDENALLKKQIELEKALGEVAKAKAQKILVFKNGKFQYMADTDAIDQAQKNLLQVQGKAYADGTLHATKGIHLVGEEGPELRVLNDGDGIIPANATKNLLDIAKMGAKGVADTVNKTLQTIYNFDISNLNLPNVENANEFFDGLKNYAYQYSYA